MFDTGSVSNENHHDWFQKSLNREDRDIFILSDRDRPMGQVRFDREKDVAEIDIAIVPEHRKKGTGTLALMETCYDYLASQKGVTTLVAKVKPDNKASIKAFLKAGFRITHTRENHVELSLFKEKQNLVVATTKSWNKDNFWEIKKEVPGTNWLLITDKDLLTRRLLSKIHPKYVFFPHWSWLIPQTVYDNFACVVFHMTDLPFGRGGSPLQNLIARGIYQTKISAIDVVEELDAGDIYCQRELDLSTGTADELFKKASTIVFKEMIPEILKGGKDPVKQTGPVVSFDRRTPEQGNLDQAATMDQVYDYIRMLDGEGYPPAFIRWNGYKLTFSKVAKKDGKLVAQCVFHPDTDSD